MTGEQLDELMTVAVNMQRDSEKALTALWLCSLMQFRLLFLNCVRFAMMLLRWLRRMRG
jgi:hypothetical protein